MLYVIGMTKKSAHNDECKIQGAYATAVKATASIRSKKAWRADLGQHPPEENDSQKRLTFAKSV